MSHPYESADLFERRAQQHAERLNRAVEEVTTEYPDFRDMPVIPKDAPCRAEGVDPRLWDAASVDEVTLTRAGESWFRIVARTLCADCPVWDACLAWALDAKEPEGIWGGTTPSERLEILNRDDLAV